MRLLFPAAPRRGGLWPDPERWGRIWRARASLAYEVPFTDTAARLGFIREELLPELEAAFALRSDAERDAFLEGFAAECAGRLGLARGVGLSSGTTALTFALVGLGVEDGDEVLVPCYTYSATALAVCNAGGVPVFVDAGRSASQLDIGQLEAKAGPRTRGVVVAHLFGHMADPASLQDFCRARGLFLIEDACQAHGVRWGGRPAGTFGVAAAFSFNFAKMVFGPGNGGLLATCDEALAGAAARMRDPESPAPGVLRSRRTPAYLDPLQAACAMAHLRAFDRILAHHADLAGRYEAGLRGLPLELPQAQAAESPSWHWYVVHTPRRDDLRLFLKRRGVETREGYVPLTRLDAFRGRPGSEGDFPAAERMCREALALPIGSHLRRPDVDHVIEAVSDFFSA